MATDIVTQVQTAYGTSAQANEVTYTYAGQGYSGTGFLLTAKDAQNNLTTYDYDGHGRPLRTRYPVPAFGTNTSSTTDYDELAYDLNSNIASRRLRDGQIISYAYDNLNRLTTKTLPSPEPATTYTYDLLGRNLTMAQNGRTITNTYDALSRLTSVNQAPLGTVNYTYDAGHTWRRIQYPGTPALTMLYAVNVAGELTSIRENATSATTGTAIATYAYDNFGRRTSVTRGNGTVTNYSFDPVSRLASLVQNVEGTATTNDVTHSFTYNVAGQIASRTRTNNSYVFPGAVTQNELYTLNGLNQATNIAGTAQVHDGRGNLTGSGGAAYSYTSENMMKTAPNSATLSYDPGLRLYETVGSGVTTRFLYAGTTMIAEYNGANVLQRRYVPGPGADEPVLWYEGAANLTDKRYYHADERGSVIAISNGSGTILNKLSYDEHGVPAATNIGRFQYTGQAWLPEVGLYHYKARMYSPKRGKFMQADPIGYDDGMNMYAYVGGDPINGTDTTGLSEDEIIVQAKKLIDNVPNNSGAMTLGASIGTGSITNVEPIDEQPEIFVDAKKTKCDIFCRIGKLFRTQTKQPETQCASPFSTRIGVESALALGVGARMGVGVQYDQRTGDWFFTSYFEGAVGLAANGGGGFSLGAPERPAEGLHTSSNANFGGGAGLLSGAAQYNISTDRGAGSGWNGNGGLSVGPALGAEATYSGGLSYAKRLGNAGGC